MSDYDFEAELKVTTAFAKTRPSFPVAASLNFADYPGVDTRCTVDLIKGRGKGLVNIQILAQQFFARRLSLGLVFTLSQAGEAMGRGVVAEVLNTSLRRDPSVHPASINLNCYPVDILDRIERDFNNRASVIRYSLQELIGERPDCRLPQIIRAIIYLANGDTEAFDDAIEQARSNYQDLIDQAEHTETAEGERIRSRDLSKPFITPSLN